MLTNQVHASSPTELIFLYVTKLMRALIVITGTRSVWENKSNKKLSLWREVCEFIKTKRGAHSFLIPASRRRSLTFTGRSRAVGVFNLNDSKLTDRMSKRHPQKKKKTISWLPKGEKFRIKRTLCLAKNIKMAGCLRVVPSRCRIANINRSTRFWLKRSDFGQDDWCAREFEE